MLIRAKVTKYAPVINPVFRFSRTGKQWIRHRESTLRL